MRILKLAVILLFIAGVCAAVYTKRLTNKTIENNAPVIRMTEDTLMITCDADRDALLTGVTAYDEEDGDLTDSIIVENASNFIRKGECRVYYAVFDSAGKVASASRLLVYEDYHSPRIDIKEPLVYSQGQKTEILSRLSAEDCIDGDISESVEILSSTIKNSVSGTYRVTVQVANSHGDTVKMDLPVVIKDDNDGSLTLKLDTSMLYLQKGDSFNAQSHLKSAEDQNGNPVNLYWNRSDEHIANTNVSGSPSTSEAGVYYVTYTVMDDYGNRGVAVLTVVVEEDENE